MLMQGHSLKPWQFATQQQVLVLTPAQWLPQGNAAQNLFARVLHDD